MIRRRTALALPALLLARAAPAAAAPAVSRIGAGRLRPRLGRPRQPGGAGRPRPAGGAGGEYAFGFGRDHDAEAVLTVTPPGGRPGAERLPVAPRDWPTQRITGLPPAPR